MCFCVHNKYTDFQKWWSHSSASACAYPNNNRNNAGPLWQISATEAADLVLAWTAKLSSVLLLWYKPQATSAHWRTASTIFFCFFTLQMFYAHAPCLSLWFWCMFATALQRHLQAWHTYHNVFFVLFFGAGMHISWNRVVFPENV